MTGAAQLPPEFASRRRLALVIGVAALMACGAGAASNPRQFFHSWLLGFLFWLGMSLGCLSLLLLHHLVGGSWGFVIQRILEAGARMVPLALLAFLPLLAGLTYLYPWTDAALVAQDAALRSKSVYLNVPFFIIRAAFYFAVWSGLAWCMTHWSSELDRTANPALARRMQLMAGPGLGIYALTITFASVDWAMSLEPHWFSTIYGVLFMVGQGLMALALSVRVLSRLGAASGPMADTVRPAHFHDLGNLMLAFTMLWAYISFSQFLIIWSGNLPEEIPWYLTRTRGGWQFVVIVLAVFHFFLPFFLLLMRFIKRKGELLARLAAAMLVMRLVDLFWLIAPARDSALSVHWMDLAAPLAIGGFFSAGFVWMLGSRPLMPLNDPRLAEAFAAGHGAHEVKGERLQHE